MYPSTLVRIILEIWKSSYLRISPDLPREILSAYLCIKNKKSFAKDYHVSMLSLFHRVSLRSY